MSYRTDVIYRFDGTECGFYSCVFDSYTLREIPCLVIEYDDTVMRFYEEREIKSETYKAERVKRSLMNISYGITSMIELGFNTCLENKYTVMYKFVRLAFTHGERVLRMITDDTVSVLNKSIGALTHEAHLLKGFIRFSEYNKTLVSVIEPKNNVLPLIAEHFNERFKREYFLIFDKKHKKALIHEPHRSKLIELEELIMPEAEGEERLYRELWQRFYDTVGIEGRYNPRCRMSHMPKRFWGNMTEFQRDNYSGFSENGKCVGNGVSGALSCDDHSLINKNIKNRD